MTLSCRPTTPNSREIAGCRPPPRQGWNDPFLPPHHSLLKGDGGVSPPRKGEQQPITSSRQRIKLSGAPLFPSQGKPRCAPPPSPEGDQQPSKTVTISGAHSIEAKHLYRKSNLAPSHCLNLEGDSWGGGCRPPFVGEEGTNQASE